MPERFSAIILAAGSSSRMKRLKPLLSLGNTIVIERVISLFKEAGIGDIRVIVGYRYKELLPVVEKLKVKALVNSDYREGMFSSVVTGVESLEKKTSAFFIMPADIPLVSPRTIRRVMEAFEQNPGKIVHPCYKGKRGHPPLIPMTIADVITEYRGKGGLVDALKECEPGAIHVEVPDENILFDFDTPGDYKELLLRWERYHARF